MTRVVWYGSEGMVVTGGETAETAVQAQKSSLPSNKAWLGLYIDHFFSGVCRDVSRDRKAGLLDGPPAAELTGRFRFRCVIESASAMGL